MEDILKKFLLYAIAFSLGVYLIRLAVCWIMEIWWILVILIVLISAGIFAWQWWRNRSGGNW